MKTILYILLFGIILLLSLETNGQDKREKNDNETNKVNTKQTSPVKMLDYLVGEWKIDKILSGEKDITQTEGSGDQTLTFTSDARYMMRSGNERIDSGAYRMNEQIRSLYLESESDAKPHEWKVDFKSGGMILSLKQGTPQGQMVRYFYSRVNPASAREN